MLPPLQASSAACLGRGGALHLLGLAWLPASCTRLLAGHHRPTARFSRAFCSTPLPPAPSRAAQALEAILRGGGGGGLPLNVKVVLEGEEEVGSPHLDTFLRRHAPRLAADFVLSADGGQLGETQPSLTLGLR